MKPLPTSKFIKSTASASKSIVTVDTFEKRQVVGGCWIGGWRGTKLLENALKRPEGQLASIRLVTGPTET